MNEPMSDMHSRHGAPPPGAEIDPVCGMVVKPTSPHRTRFQGHDYGFCSAGCLKKFVANPATYLTAVGEPPVAPSRVIQNSVKVVATSLSIDQEGRVEEEAGHVRSSITTRSRTSWRSPTQPESGR